MGRAEGPSLRQTDARLSIEDVLAGGGPWVSTTAGTSMWPMLRDRQDTIVVMPVEGGLRPLDIALYRRGNSYVLHRVIAVRDGGYRILGDNCLRVEDVEEGQVLGVLEQFWRGERRCDPHSPWWMTYARLWLALWPARCVLVTGRHLVGRVSRRLACLCGLRDGR